MNARTRTRIKICGITRLVDAEAVVAAGADALGLNFAAQSPRRIAPGAAAEISLAVAGSLVRVGLFVDPEPAAVERVLRRVDLDLLQFHGAESAEFCEGFGLPYMKAHRIADSLDIDALHGQFPTACCHLLDAYVPGQPGGTGQRFDWGLWPARTDLRLVLAGGLAPENVAQAMYATRPFAVDVSGGVEGATKGVKSAAKIRRFVAAVRQADAGR